jgi:hypothetical protein
LEFKIIIETYNKINDKRTHLANRISVLKTKYNDLIHNNNRRIFLFCLDSLHFQYKCLTIELEDIIRFITFINNRMYADYYKLYNLIILQANDKYSLPLPLIDVKKFPVYKDHDPFYEYSIDHIIELHDIIIQIIHTLFVQYSRKEREIYEHTDESNGFSIMNFINTLEYENSLLREQISLQISYVSFFHNLQTNCLNRLLSKIQNLHNEVESNLIIKNEPKQTVKIDNDIDLNLFFVSPMDNDDLSVEHILTELEHSVNSNEKIMKSVEEVIGASIGASIEDTVSTTSLTDSVSVTASCLANVENIVQENGEFVGTTESSEVTESSESTIGLTAPIESKNSNKTQLRGNRIRTTPLANADGEQSIICAISPIQTEDNN